MNDDLNPKWTDVIVIKGCVLQGLDIHIVDDDGGSFETVASPFVQGGIDLLAVGDTVTYTINPLIPQGRFQFTVTRDS